MVKATVTLPDGTHVELDGSSGELQRLLDLYSGGSSAAPAKKGRPKKASAAKSAKSLAAKKEEVRTEGFDADALASSIRSADQAKAIDKGILKSTSQLDRAILPLYAASKFGGADKKLTVSEVSQVLSKLGISMATPNVGKTLRNNPNYVERHDSEKGDPASFTLNRRGEQYIEEVIARSAGSKTSKKTRTKTTKSRSRAATTAAK